MVTKKEISNKRVNGLLYLGHPEVPLPPDLPKFPRLDTARYFGHGGVMAPGAPGYSYDELGAVIPDSKPGTSRPRSGHGSTCSVLSTEQGVGVGVGLGLLAAMCIPGIGMFAGSVTIVARLILAGAVLGGIFGGIYGYMADRDAAKNAIQCDASAKHQHKDHTN